MTQHVESAKNPEKKTFDDEYIALILEKRQQPSACNALRRGGNESTLDRSYPYLVRFWQNTPWLRTPLLLHSTAAATCSHIYQEADISLGQLARELVRHGIITEATLETRLLAVQTMTLPNAHRLLMSILSVADTKGMGLDWKTVWLLYRWWDQPKMQLRRRTRRRLLEDFYYVSKITKTMPRKGQ